MDKLTIARQTNQELEYVSIPFILYQTKVPSGKVLK